MSNSPQEGGRREEEKEAAPASHVGRRGSGDRADAWTPASRPSSGRCPSPPAPAAMPLPTLSDPGDVCFPCFWLPGKQRSLLTGGVGWRSKLRALVSTETGLLRPAGGNPSNPVSGGDRRRRQGLWHRGGGGGGARPSMSGEGRGHATPWPAWSGGPSALGLQGWGSGGCVHCHGQGDGSQGAGQACYCNVPSFHTPELGSEGSRFPPCLGATFPGSGLPRSSGVQGPAASREARLEAGPECWVFRDGRLIWRGSVAMPVCPCTLAQRELLAWPAALSACAGGQGGRRALPRPRQLVGGGYRAAGQGARRQVRPKAARAALALQRWRSWAGDRARVVRKWGRLGHRAWP